MYIFNMFALKNVLNDVLVLWDEGIFCVESACSARICTGFLWLRPTDQRHAADRRIGDSKVDLWCECERQGSGYIELATCPGFTSSLP